MISAGYLQVCSTAGQETVSYPEKKKKSVQSCKRTSAVLVSEVKACENMARGILYPVKLMLTVTDFRLKSGSLAMQDLCPYIPGFLHFFA